MSSHPGADPAHEVGGTTHRPEPVLIARCPEHGLHGCRNECFVCGQPVEQVPMVTASDAAKFAEREYERVCEERDSVKVKLARVREAAQEVADLESRSLPLESGESMRAAAMSRLRRVLNNPDSTEVDNG